MPEYKTDICLKDYIAEYPDFPKEGINFKDISPLLAHPEVMRYVCHKMAEKCQWADMLVAVDARWFIFAPKISEILNIPWVMCRKKWKLPGEVESLCYGLEYGQDTIEIQKWVIKEGEKVAIIDDLLATGWTAWAAISLVEKLGWIIHHCAFVICLDEAFLLGLESRKELGKYKCSSVVSYH